MRLNQKIAIRAVLLAAAPELVAIRVWSGQMIGAVGKV